MSDNARFHNKLHRKNHHSAPTTGYPDSATDPIASYAEPFQGDFVIQGNLIASGSISSVFYTLSNISIPTPVLSTTVGFNPTNSLIVQLSGVKYAIPVTYVGSNAAPVVVTNSLSGVTTFSNGVSVLGSLSGVDSNNWNLIFTTVEGNSANWNGGNSAFTVVNPNSAYWQATTTVVQTNSASWQNNQSVDLYVIANSATFDGSYNVTVYSKLSSQPYTFNTNISSIQANIAGNQALSAYSGVLAGAINTASGYASLVVGGGSNTASGRYSAILGGTGNSISGDCSFIIGTNIIKNAPNYTFVNNISSQCLVQTSSAYSSFLSVSPDVSGQPLSNVRAQFTSNINEFSQVNHQNTNSGTYASTDIVVTADNGNDSQNYLDFGINSSTYTASAYSITGPNDAYIYAQSKNLAVGTASNADIVLHTGGTLASNERVRITSSGYVGIGTSTPNTALSIIGNVSASGNMYFKNAVYIQGALAGSIQPINGNNTVSNIYSYVGSGNSNIATGIGVVIAGGCSNQAVNDFSSVIGGCLNNVTGVGSVIGGGVCNTTCSNYGSILGGSNNLVCCYSSVGGGCSNIANGPCSVIGGGYSNTNSGSASFIAGGYGNCITGTLGNVFILGSGINATCSGYTYVNGIIASGCVYANGACIGDLCSTGTVNVYNLTAFTTTGYQSQVTDSIVDRNSSVGKNLTVVGAISSPSFAYFTGNKFLTSLGNNVLSTFTVNHNLSTSDVSVAVTDNSTNQIVYPSITISNSCQVQVGFSFAPSSAKYNISIVGF